MEGMAGGLLIIAAYFIPTIIAQRRKHPNATPIFLTNLFLGWTGIGWIFAIIWSTTKVNA